MIWAICVVEDVSIYLDILTRETLIILERLSFLLGCRQILHSAAWPAHPGSLDMISHDFCCSHVWCWWSLFGEYCIRHRIVFYSITSEYNSTFVLLVFCLQISIFQMTYVHQWCKMNFCARRSGFIDHLFFTSDFCQVPRRNFLQFFPFLVHCCFCCWNFYGLRHRNKFVNQITML